MKKITFFTFLVLFYFLSQNVSAQVGINNDESLPDPSSMLDVKATGLGMLVPRMALAERPVSPAEGLLIYQTDANPGFYFFDGFMWKRVSSDSESAWQKVGNNVFYNNGNIGIGTENPQSSLVIAKANPEIGLIDTSYNSNIYLIAPSEAATGGLGTSTNHGFPLFTNNEDRVWIGNEGNVGIGNLSPSERLDVAGKTKTNALQVTDGAGDGLVLKSDGMGNASWMPMFNPPVAGNTLANDTSFTAKIINGSEIVYDTINLDAGGGWIKSETIIEVCINITHTYDWDLEVYLIGPEGTEIELTTNNGDGGDNYTGTCFTKSANISITDGEPPFTGEFLPEGNFYDLDGNPMSGNWVLKITDDYPSEDDGVLNSWSIRFTEVNFDENEKWNLFNGNLYSDKYVGIGTTQPYGLLHVKAVKGSTYFPSWGGSETMSTVILGVMEGQGFNPQFRFSGGYDGYIDIGKDTLGSFVVETDDQPRLLVSRNGNVGIGTAPTGPAKLQVDGTIQSMSGGFVFPDGTVQSTAGGPGTNFWQHDGSLIFYNQGNVGVGTPNPDEKFQVGEYSNPGSKYISIRTPGGNAYKAGIKLNHYSNWYGWTLESDETQTIFNIKRHWDDANGVSALSISGFNGYVGIGTTTPSAPLDIFKGTVTLQGGPAIRLTRSYNGYGYGSAIYDGWGPAQETMVFGVANNGDPTAAGNEKMVITESGNVGIGTTVPAYKLQVNGMISSMSGGFRFPDGTVQTSAASTTGGVWSTNGAKMYYNGGNVGIGTSDPNYYLHVSGSRPDGSIAYFQNYGSANGNNDGIKISLTMGNGWGASNNFMAFESVWSNGNIKSGEIEMWNADERVLPSGSFSDVMCQLIGMGILVTDPLALAAFAANWSLYNLCHHNGVAYVSNNADYAEYIEKLDPEEFLLNGTVVGVKDGKISKNTEGADKVMAISSAPVVLGNSVPESDKHLYDIAAFLGQVPVWVMGKVNSGDYIVASGKNNGAAIAVSPENLTEEQLTQIVGRAWESSENADLKTVNTVVGIESGETAQILKKQQSKIDELEAKVEQISSLEERLIKLENSMNMQQNSLQANK